MQIYAHFICLFLSFECVIKAEEYLDKKREKKNIRNSSSTTELKNLRTTSSNSSMDHKNAASLGTLHEDKPMDARDVIHQTFFQIFGVIP